jgi:hypothetical protein
VAVIGRRKLNSFLDAQQFMHLASAVEVAPALEIVGVAASVFFLAAADQQEGARRGQRHQLVMIVLEAGTRRVIYLYGICDVYPLSASVKLAGQAAVLQLAVETMLIKNASDPQLAGLPDVIQKEIRTISGMVEQANVAMGNNLNRLMLQENQFLQSSGINADKATLQSRFASLKLQLSAKRQEVISRRRAYELARKALAEHLNGEQRIEIATQGDLERNRSQDVIKSQLMKECMTQFRSMVKSLYSQEKVMVAQSMLVESSAATMMKQVKLKNARVLGIYISETGSGEIQYTASVAFRFGFEYTSAVSGPANITKRSSVPAYRSKAIELSENDVKAMLIRNGFYDSSRNPQARGIANDFELQQDGKVVSDRATGLMWERSGSVNYMKFADALEYVRQLNAERFAGFNDWRLPTLEEAMSLMESEKLNGDLFIDSVFDKTQGWIWTADTQSAGVAWVVYFYHGDCYGSYLTNHYYVRAVR